MSRQQSLQFKKLVETHCTGLYRFAFCLVNDEQTACDLTQHTFFLYANKGASLGAEVKIKPWLFATLHNEFLRQRSAPKIEPATTPKASSPPPEAEVGALDGPSAAAAFVQMPEDVRATLALFYLRELTYREIAEVLNAPIELILARVADGKALLRKILAGRTHQE